VPHELVRGYLLNCSLCVKSLASKSVSSQGVESSFVGRQDGRRAPRLAWPEPHAPRVSRPAWSYGGRLLRQAFRWVQAEVTEIPLALCYLREQMDCLNACVNGLRPVGAGWNTAGLANSLWFGAR